MSHMTESVPPSGWTSTSALLMLVVVWSLFYASVHLAVLASKPHLARLKPSDCRSPGMLAGHLAAIFNAVTCIAMATCWLHVSEASGPLGGLLPGAHKPFLYEMPPLGTGIFYLIYAAYCVFHVLFVVTGSWPIDHMNLMHYVFSALAAMLILSDHFVREVGPFLLLLEAPTPFLALHAIFTSFRVEDGPWFQINMILLVAVFFCCRIMLFGSWILWFVTHPDISQLMAKGSRAVTFLLLVKIFMLQLAWFSKIVTRVRRDAQNQEKELTGASPV